MDHGELKTHLWNLSMATTASTMLAACGPFVIPEGETDTEAQTDTSTEPDTDTSVRPTEPTTDPSDTDTAHPPGWCDGPEDCQPGYECIDNFCVPYDYCDTGGCCYDCCYDDGCYYYCYSDQDCGPYGVCGGYGGGFGNGCLYVQLLPECDDVPQVMALPLPTAVGGGVAAMAFVDTNGDAARDLVVARTGGVELFQGFGAAPIVLPVPPELGVTDAASADFDGDGDMDLVLSTTQGTLLVLTGDGTGGFAPAMEQPVAPLAILQIEALQWNGDGTPDVATTADNEAVIYLTDAAGMFTGGVPLTNTQPRSLAGTDFDGDAYGDLMIQDTYDGLLFLGDATGEPSVDAYLPGAQHGERRLATGPIDPGPPYETIGYTSMDGWALIELWANELDGPQLYGVPGVDGTTGVVGDFDGDGTGDVLTGGAGYPLILLHGQPGYPTLWCQSLYYDLPTGLGALESGDFDGNGRPDVAQWSVSGDVTVLLTQ